LKSPHIRIPHFNLPDSTSHLPQIPFYQVFEVFSRAHSFLQKAIDRKFFDFFTLPAKKKTGLITQAGF
jgi:hypothetical protein